MIAGYGISPTEIDGIADAYKRWFACPKGMGTGYGNVYYHNGKLCSIPYYHVIDDLHYKLVGVEINGVIYLKGYEMNVDLCDIPQALDQIKAYVFSERTCCGVTPNFKIDIPTLREVDVLQKQLHNNFDTDLNLCAIYGKYWVRSDDGNETKFAVIDQLHSQVAIASGKAAIVIPVVHAQENTFFGTIDKFGIPSNETTEVYKDLCNFALNS